MINCTVDVIMKHLPPATAALLPLALLLLHPSLTNVHAHDLMGDGCGLNQYPHLMRLMEVEQNPGHFFGPLPPNHAPVQGLHVSYEGRASLRVSWMNPAPPNSTLSSTAKLKVKDVARFAPVCRYGEKDVSQHTTNGLFYSYSAGLFNHTLNTVVLNLTGIPCAGSTSGSACVKDVYYQCGDQGYGFSDVLHVQVQNEDVPLSEGPQFAVVGDMGIPHGLKTVEAIAKRMTPAAGSKNRVEILIHAGDISYANHYDDALHNNSWVWVDYMNSLQAVAAHVPYMTAPGNHEGEFSFAAYLNWLPMPYKASGSTSPFWFSFDYLGVHVLAFSTEHDFSHNSTQYQWMVQDLKKANENRARVPWIVVMGHRPLYCSSLVCWGRCHEQAMLYRAQLEELLNKQHVDVVITGHNHQYERSYPVYNNKTTQKHYINPKAPVYIVDGAAGCPELNDPTFEPFVDWRGNYKASFDTGFLLMTPTASQLKFDYVMSTTDDVFDSFTIVRK